MIRDGASRCRKGAQSATGAKAVGATVVVGHYLGKVLAPMPWSTHRRTSMTHVHGVLALTAPESVH